MVAADHIAIAKAVPVERVVSHLKLRRHGHDLIGACPVCAGTDRFAVHVSKQVFNCRGCGAKGDVIALAMHVHGVDFVGAVELLTGNRAAPHREPPPAPGARKPDDESYQRRQVEKAHWLWHERRRPLIGSIGETYLRKARGYTGPLPSTLGFLLATDKQPPAVIAAFGLVFEDRSGALTEPRNVHAVHLIKLRNDGSGKADIDPNKITIGSPTGKPITLTPPHDGEPALIICEGIEDALSAHQAIGQAVWASASAGYMPHLAACIPAFCETVTIYAHPDPAGERGARALADRLVARAIPEVFVEGLKP